MVERRRKRGAPLQARAQKKKGKIFIYLFFSYYIHKKHFFFFLNNISWISVVGFWV